MWVDIILEMCVRFKCWHDGKFNSTMKPNERTSKTSDAISFFALVDRWYLVYSVFFAGYESILLIFFRTRMLSVRIWVIFRSFRGLTVFHLWQSHHWLMKHDIMLCLFCTTLRSTSSTCFIVANKNWEKNSQTYRLEYFKEMSFNLEYRIVIFSSYAALEARISFILQKKNLKSIGYCNCPCALFG